MTDFEIYNMDVFAALKKIKPESVDSSVKDRLTNSFEYVFRFPLCKTKKDNKGLNSE